MNVIHKKKTFNIEDSTNSIGDVGICSGFYRGYPLEIFEKWINNIWDRIIEDGHLSDVLLERFMFTDRERGVDSFFNDSFSEGRLLSEGIRTVILGKPNVGKSSLLNILLGEERAIVTDIAGTTRDAIEEKLLLDGLTLNIVDTAGIRYTDDPVEKIGVERAFKYADSADLIIMMVDSSNEIDDEDKKIFDYIKDKKSVVLMNKSDLEQVISVSDLKDLTDKKIIQISAKNSEGIKELSDYIKVLFISGVIDYDNEVFISNSRQKELLNRSEQNLKDVIKSIDMDLPEDFYTIDLKNAYEALGGIIGESLEDDVINEIFSKFCMGK